MTPPKDYAGNEKSQKLLDLAYQVIEQTHYERLDQYPQVPLRADIAEIRPGDITCLFLVTELVFNKEKGNLDAFRTVLNALHSCGATCIMLLECREGHIDLYLGAVNKTRYDNPYYLNTIREILSTGIQGNLPGSALKEIIKKEDIDRKLMDCLTDGFDAQCITSVSCIASPIKKDDPVIGLEKLADAVGNKNFSLLVIADPVDSEHIQLIKNGYESLATELSEYESYNHSVQSSTSTTLSLSRSESFTKSISDSISFTQSQNVSRGWSSGNNAPEAGKAPLIKRLTAAGGSMALASVTKQPMAGYAVMNVASSWMSGGSHTENQSDTVSIGVNVTDSQSVQIAGAVQDGSSRSDGVTYGLSVQTTHRDRHIQELLSKIDAYLKWLNHCANFGMFNCGTYIISGSASTNLLVASQYQALLQGEEEISHIAVINTWTVNNGIEDTQNALVHLMHPTVLREKMEFSPAMLISSKELARQMTLPQSSIIGVSVMEYTPFGREVLRKSPLEAGKMVKIGSVFHMGLTMQTQPVLLDLQSLSAHTFIAGTNGSGKSNAIFRILEELLRNKIPFMVIEPAKGEYKNVFGNEENVLVFGTNKSKTPLLRLNPFWFNDDIDVKEHIARLMDVFQASWPMYAAMPSVLNSAIENAYRTCGWNLTTSRCVRFRVFPTVEDVLRELGKKMDSTAFSDEVKGNYTGALSARLEALTTGLYEDIFSGSDLGDETFFESNTLIDLSRAGSPEISAMIMGMLLIRLREYRISKGAMNHPLQHVTVLEEAHHLLRKTSGAQSEDSSNLMGKAVEMISNAIAEMRSYGDGFIIADQSPGLLDTSVLRNTNTKIVMRLPESKDREMVGNTMGMNQKQNFELSRLKTGIAAIYQKDWLEPVLCHVDLAEHTERLYQFDKAGNPVEQSYQRQLHTLLSQLLKHHEMESSEIEKLILSSAISGTSKKNMFDILKDNKSSWRARAHIVSKLYPLTMEVPRSLSVGFDEWLEDIYDVNMLPKTELSRLVIAANLRDRAESEHKWEEIARIFYDDRAESDRLKRIRGHALEAVLFGEGPYARDIPESEVQQIRLALSEGSETDHMLLEQFAAFLRNNHIRQRGELLPYSMIAWQYLGANQTWDEGYESLKKMDFHTWEEIMRRAVRTCVICNAKTEEELFNLTLQCKGSLREVREFYYPWLTWKQSIQGNCH